MALLKNVLIILCLSTLLAGCGASESGSDSNIAANGPIDQTDPGNTSEPGDSGEPIDPGETTETTPEETTPEETTPVETTPEETTPEETTPEETTPEETTPEETTPEETTPEETTPEETTPVETTPEALPSITLQWGSPGQRENFESISSSEIDGYEVIATNTNTNETETQMVADVTVTINDLTPGLWRFQVATVDTEGLKSHYSVLTKQID
ncbi:hypothetical protein A9Q99_20270 [Gammaproteobacteria bacterium 45_16_T64]|nr:hypothetical protein A9Q99_20270 [Gammaproteobacteria bacterium 45_16_T64]